MSFGFQGGAARGVGVHHCDVGVERGGEGRAPVGVGEVVVEREVGSPVGVRVDSKTVAGLD